MNEAILKSPTSAFIEKMVEEIELNKNVVFYLATDCRFVEKKLVQQFGEKVITAQRIYSRMNTRGIQDALVDILCLSKTSKVLGSFNSTFTNLAAELGSIDKIIITKS
jgi:hypothetical protein